MSNHENGDPFEKELSLELSQESLASLRSDLANMLIRKGEVEQNPGVYRAPNESEPYRFFYPIEPKFAKSIFYPNDDSIEVRKAVASYSTPYSLEHEDDESSMVGHGVYVTVYSYFPIAGVPEKEWLYEDFWITIGDDYSFSSLKGTTDREYSRGGRRISPTDFESKITPEMSEDERIQLIIEDTADLERSMEVGDAEQMQKIIDYIESHPALTK